MSAQTLAIEAEAQHLMRRLFSRQIWDRALPAGLFVGMVLLRRDAWRDAVQAFLNAPSWLDSTESALMLLYLGLSAVFYLFIAALFLGRYAPRAGCGGFGPTALAFAGTCGAAPLVALPIVNGTTPWTLIANALTVVGMGASCLALGTLGRHFGIRPRARGVVSHGVYRYVRHPLYMFEAVAQVGTLLVVLSPVAVAIFGAYLALQFRRAVLEERLLAATFPAYREYQARTWRFIPKVA